MDGFGTSPVFRHYREALGKNNVQLAVIDEDDNLDFVKENDIVLLRTASERIINTIREKRIKTTAEDFNTYESVRDKLGLAKFLSQRNVLVPRQYSIDEVTEGKIYFVKPRYGSDSMGITSKNKCSSKTEITEVLSVIKLTEGQECVIEDFIDGEECTVACLSHNGEVYTYPIGIECSETDGIQTRACKVGFKEYCHSLNIDDSLTLKGIAENVFILLGIKHHARIDFRKGRNGKFYLIDVNLLPGLGIQDHFAKSLLLTQNYSYIDTIRAIIGSATK